MESMCSLLALFMGGDSTHGQFQFLGLISPIPHDDWQNLTLTASAQYLYDGADKGTLSFPIGLSYQF
jgi:hypothetical protein